MKAGNILSTFFTMLFSRDFYRFIVWDIYNGFNRFVLLKKLRRQYPDTIIPDDIIISNPNRISIGGKSILGNGCNLFCGYSPNEGSINMGTQVILGHQTSVYAGAGKITIENNVDIGIHSVLSTQTRSLKQNPVQEPKDFEHIYGEIFIGEGTMVAANVTILSGSSVGKFCNIVAGSVVQGIYPDYTTLAGNPARPLPRTNFI